MRRNECLLGKAHHGRHHLRVVLLIGALTALAFVAFFVAWTWVAGGSARNDDKFVDFTHDEHDHSNVAELLPKVMHPSAAERKIDLNNSPPPLEHRILTSAAGFVTSLFDAHLNKQFHLRDESVQCAVDCIAFKEVFGEEHSADDDRSRGVHFSHLRQSIEAPYLSDSPSSWITPENIPHVATDAAQTNWSQQQRFALAKLSLMSTPHPSILSSYARRLFTIKKYATLAFLSVLQSLSSGPLNSFDNEVRNHLWRQSASRLVESHVTMLIRTLRLIAEDTDGRSWQDTLRALKGISLSQALRCATLRRDNTSSAPLESDACEVAAISSLLSSDREITPVLQRKYAPHMAADLYASFQPTLRCFSMWRECEHPDGCRFQCNTEYLLHRGETTRQERCGGERFIGCGSNNNFMWEENIVRLFSTRGDGALRWIATFDCTLKDAVCPVTKNLEMCRRERYWSPPRYLTDGAHVSWLQSSVCLGVHPSAPTMKFSELLQQLNASDSESNALCAIANNKSGSPLGRDSHLFPATKPCAQQSRVAVKTAEKCSGGVVGLLKIDIEEGEYRSIGEWLRDALAAPRLDGSLFGFAQISQLQIEVHRLFSSKGTDVEKMSKSLWWLEYIKWELASLGFVLVSKEKNHFAKQCFEFVFVRHEYFVESEVWMRSEH